MHIYAYIIRVNIFTPKLRNKRGSKWSKVIPKASREDIKLYSSTSSTQDRLWWDLSCKELRQPSSLWHCWFKLHGVSMGLELLTANGFLQHTIYIPVTSTSVSFTLTASCVVLSISILPGPPGLPLKSEWKLPWTNNGCILHTSKISITWVKPTLDISLSTNCLVLELLGP